MSGFTLKQSVRLSDADDSTKMAAVVAAEESRTSTKKGLLSRVVGFVDLLDKVGEVQGSPTANTILDRLKAIATALAATIKVTSPALTTAAALVASGQQTSNEVDCSTNKALAIRVPAGGLNGVSSLKFVASHTTGGTFLPVADEDGVELTITITWASVTGAHFRLPASIFGSINFLKVVTQTTSADTTYTIVQGA